MAEAVQPDPFAYRSFNDFFTRALRPDARPIARGPRRRRQPRRRHREPDAARSRATCCCKRRDSTTRCRSCSAGDAEAAATYRGGSFACIYLAPYNYHRIHMPLRRHVRATTSTCRASSSASMQRRRAPCRASFARNERLICDFTTPLGRMAVILVGALFVGSIETVHCGEVNPPPRRRKTPTADRDGPRPTRSRRAKSWAASTWDRLSCCCSSAIASRGSPTLVAGVDGAAGPAHRPRGRRP